MLRSLADYIKPVSTPDYFTIFTKFFNAGSYLHIINNIKVILMLKKFI